MVLEDHEFLARFPKHFNERDLAELSKQLPQQAFTIKTLQVLVPNFHLNCALIVLLVVEVPADSLLLLLCELLLL